MVTWTKAKKTKGLRAKPMSALITDQKVISRLLIDTLEGRIPLASNSIFCLGVDGEPWQQSAKALLKKYDVKDIDDEGWMICHPKAENVVEYFISSMDCLIHGQWGETINNIPNLQRALAGDAIVRNPQDPTDQWVVKKNIWLNTYADV